MPPALTFLCPCSLSPALEGLRRSMALGPVARAQRPAAERTSRGTGTEPGAHRKPAVT